jgi:hypothetical protein
MAGLFLTSSVKILRQAWQEYSHGHTRGVGDGGHDHAAHGQHGYDDCCGQSHAPAPAAVHGHSH